MDAQIELKFVSIGEDVQFKEMVQSSVTQLLSYAQSNKLGLCRHSP